jgi:Fe-S oxidoreductase
MVAAAMDGVLDFRDADPLDKRWWFRLRLALDHVERADIVKRDRLYYDYTLAILSRSDLTDQSNRQFTKDAEKRIARMAVRWRPWEKPENDQAARVDRMVAAWAAEFGDPRNPETQKAIAETVRMLEKMDVRARMPKNAPTVLG